jgi:hypothetical protein
MDFTQTNGLSMIGNDDFVTEEQLSGYVTLDTAQTITGDKTLSGTTTITGNISANSVDITPQELGFIGGLTSDAQTQLNGKVGITNDETITGDKTFDIGTITTFDGDVNSNGTFTNYNILENYTIINNQGGAVIDNQSGAEIRLSAGSEITANGVSISPIEMSYLNNVSSNLQTQLDGKVSKTIADTISAIKTFSVLPESSVVPTTDVQLANKKYVDDTIVAGSFVTIGGTQTITGQKTFTTDLFAAYTSATNNFRLGNVVGKSFMDFRSGGTSSGGGYDVRIESNGGTATAGFGDYVIEAGTTTLDTKTTNTIKSGGNAKITTTSSNIDFTGDGETCRAIGTSSSNIGFYPTAIAGGLKGMLGFDTDFGGGIMRLRGRGTGVKVDISSESTDGTDALGIIARNGGGIYINSAGGSGRVKLLVNGGTAKFEATSTNCYVNNQFFDITANTYMYQNAQTLTLVGSDHTYVRFCYPNFNSNNAYIGYGGANTTRFDIVNTMGSGDIYINTNKQIDLAIGGATKLTTTSSVTTITNPDLVINSDDTWSVGKIRVGFTGVPLCSYSLSGTPTTFNGQSFQISIGGMPDNSTSNAPLSFTIPFTARLAAWTMSGDGDSNNSFTMRFRLSSALSGGGTIYYDQQGNMAVGGLQNQSCMMSLVSDSGWIVTQFNATPLNILGGTQLFAFCNTNANVGTEFNITLFFQQL